MHFCNAGRTGSAWSGNPQNPLAALAGTYRFFRLVWQTNKLLTAGNVIFRLIKSGLPLLMLYVGKEIIDEVIEAYSARRGNVPMNLMEEILVSLLVSGIKKKHIKYGIGVAMVPQATQW